MTAAEATTAESAPAATSGDADRDGGWAWGWMLTAGIVTSLLGLMLLVYPVAASVATTWLVGISFMVGGVFTTISGIAGKSDGSRVWSIVLGVLILLAGISLTFNPLAGMMTLTLVFTIWLLVDGVVSLIAGIARKGAHRGWTITSGILSLVLGGLLLAGWPTTGAWVIGTFAGITFLFRGMALTMLSFDVRRLGKA